MTSIEKRRLRQRKYYARHRERLKKKKLEDYYKNRDANILNMRKYAEKYIKPFTGKVGLGGYNITRAERNKEQWLTETLILYKLKMTDIDGTIFYKVGLTKNLRNRLYFIPYEAEIIDQQVFNKYDAVYKEISILATVAKYKTQIKFGGHTECFIEN